MKTTIYNFLIAALALFVVSCSSNSANSEAAESAAITVDELLSNAESLTDSLVVIEGVCTHTCVHGATKIFLAGTNDSTVIRVEAAELGAFDPEVVNNLVSVKGYLREQRIDENYLNQWQQRIDESDDENSGEKKVGCETERASHGMAAETANGQIAEYRARIQQKVENGDNPWLSFYYVEATEYEIK